MNRRETWYGNLWRWPVITLALVLLLSLWIIWGPRGFKQLWQLKQERAKLLNQNMEIDRENRELFKKIQQFEKDPRAAEDTVRRELGWVKPQEMIIFFEEKNKK
jgi:cell division protein FtsB